MFKKTSVYRRAGDSIRQWVGLGGILLLALASSLLPGCRTAPPMRKVDFSEPGWTVKRGQAVWTLADNEVEIAGTLLAGVRGVNETFVQFAKGPAVIAIARSDQLGWCLDVPMRNKTYAHRGRPPVRVVWFQLADALRNGTPRKGWTWTETANGNWTLRSDHTGECLEGVFTP